MKGGKNRQPLGYTILEVMIVLAISGAMFLIAASFINGKQERAAFTSAVNNMASQLQATIQQVTTGEYSDIPLTCAAGTPPSFTSNTAPSQGTASQCVFVGKFLHFWPNNAPGGSSGPSGYETFTMAGNRLVGSNPAQSLAQVSPVPVYSATVDLTTQNVIPQNLDIDTNGTINGITVVDTTNAVHSTVYGFGFLQSFGSLATGGSNPGTYLSTAQTTNLVYNPNLIIPNQTGVNAINTLRTTSLAYAKSATICLSDGSQFATISIGGVNSTNLNVTPQILGPAGDPTCH